MRGNSKVAGLEPDERWQENETEHSMCWTSVDQQTVPRCADGKHLYARECGHWTFWTFPDLSASAEYGKLSLCSRMRLGLLDLPVPVERSSRSLRIPLESECGGASGPFEFHLPDTARLRRPLRTTQETGLKHCSPGWTKEVQSIRLAGTLCTRKILTNQVECIMGLNLFSPSDLPAKLPTQNTGNNRQNATTRKKPRETTAKKKEKQQQREETSRDQHRGGATGKPGPDWEKRGVP